MRRDIRRYKSNLGRQFFRDVMVKINKLRSVCKFVKYVEKNIEILRGASQRISHLSSPVRLSSGAPQCVCVCVNIYCGVAVRHMVQIKKNTVSQVAEWTVSEESVGEIQEIFPCDETDVPSKHLQRLWCWTSAGWGLHRCLDMIRLLIMDVTPTWVPDWRNLKLLLQATESHLPIY